MGDLPKSTGLLSGVVAFSAAGLLGLVRGCAPLCVMKRALVCALVLGLVVRFSTYLALNVVRDGVRQHHRERSSGTQG
jgi:hypothetical protein